MSKKLMLIAAAICSLSLSAFAQAPAAGSSDQKPAAEQKMEKKAAKKAKKGKGKKMAKKAEKAADAAPAAAPAAK